MLEDALKSVKEAEKKAGILIEEADAKAASIVEEAKAKAKAMKEETASKIRSGSQEAEEAAHKASEAKLAEAEEQAQKEADALRQLVEPKREEAVEAVITSLVETEKREKEGCGYGNRADAADQYLCIEEESESDPGTSAGTGSHGDRYPAGG